MHIITDFYYFYRLQKQKFKMFILTEMRKMVRVVPYKFKGTLNDAASEELNRQLANKVKKFIVLMK